MNLYLYIGPGTEEAQKTRERLKGLADNRKVPGVSMRSAGRLGKWHFIYRRPILSQEELRSSDSDMISQKVEEVTGEFYNKDYWLLVNAVREEFGLQAISLG